MHHLALLLILPAILLAGEPASIKPPLPEEVVVLDMLNYHREFPARGDVQLAAAMRSKQITASLHSWSRAATKSGTFSPLVFNPQLCEAARALLSSGVKPVENSRFDASAAIKAAGYASDKDHLALFAFDCPTLALAYATAMTNSICETTKGTYTYRDYTGQVAVKGTFREAGVVVSSAKGKFSVVMVLAQGTAKRHLGGIVYSDANRDRRCDLGEGRAGVKVSCGGASMTTAAGGAWWLATDSLDQGEVTFTGEGTTASRPVAKGATIAGIEWRLPNAADQKTADRLIAAAEKVSKNPDEEQTRGPLAALLVGTRLCALDDDRQKKIDDLVEPVRSRFASVQKTVLTSLGEEPAEFKKKLADAKKLWKGAIPTWFKEAEGLGVLRQEVNSVLAAPPAQGVKLAQPLITRLAKAMTDSGDPVFFDQYKTWEAALQDIDPDPKKK